MSSPRLILASTSPYRRELLARLGVPFETLAPRVDEESLKDPSLSPRALAEKLAMAKARSLALPFQDAIVIGSDQTCACEGVLLNKPGSAAAACEQLAFLSGKTHELFTAVCVMRGERVLQHTNVTRLAMRSLSAAEIERYVAADQPYDCVGSYKLEQRGIALFDEIESSDHTAIIGLPLMALSKILREW